MKADDIKLLNILGRPALAPDGTVLVAVTRPHLDQDRYGGELWSIPAEPGSSAQRAWTRGPRDSAPVISPDGSTVVFLRAPEVGPAQLYAIDLHGGEARKLTSHPLGAGTPVFSADGNRIAYLAPVPEPGRYGTDPEVSADAEPPRAIGWMSYRRDGKGFLLDQPDQVFVLALAPDAVPVQLTDERAISDGPVFLPDGRLVYVRTVDPDRPQCELATVASVATVGAVRTDGTVDGANSADPVAGTLLAQLPGTATALAVRGDTLFYLGVECAGIDVAGRTAALWSIPVAGGTPRRMTGLDVEVDTGASPFALGEAVLVCVLDRGSVSLRAVPIGADHAALPALTSVLDGRRVLTSFAGADLPAGQQSGGGTTIAAVIANQDSPAELIMIDVTANGAPAGPERALTDFAAPLRGAGLIQQGEITATAPDGYPVHGFLLVPPGPGPHPVLLVVHGGPHAAYGWGLFDEAQVYAAAGYAVVLPNPRGSAGYGHDHGRSILGRLGTVDADDVLALLDAALERPDCAADRVGVMGGSYGGFMTSWLASHAPERFTAAISERAVNAWDSFAGSSDIGYYFAENYVGAGRDSQWRASPLAYADEISIPLLIIHSEHDWRCPIEQGQRLFVALKRRSAEVEFLVFPAEGHELSRSGRPRHRLQRFAAILAWWQQHLPVETG